MSEILRTDERLRRYTGEEARAALGRPWPILPCRSLEVLNEKTGEVTIQKRPARGAKWGHLQGLAESNEYRTWAAALWAFITGAGTGVVVLDADTDEALHGMVPHAETGRGVGGHVYVKHPGWPVKTTTNVLPGLDVRGDGGLAYFLGASLKGPYRLLRDVEPYEVADIPEHVARAAGLLEPPKPKERPAIAPVSWDGEGHGDPQVIRWLEERCEAIREADEIGVGWNETFHTAVFAAAGAVLKGVLDETFAREALYGACSDPIDAQAIFDSSWAAGTEAGEYVPQPIIGVDPDLDRIAEEIMARAVNAAFGGILLRGDPPEYLRRWRRIHLTWNQPEIPVEDRCDIRSRLVIQHKITGRIRAVRVTCGTWSCDGCRVKRALSVLEALRQHWGDDGEVYVIRDSGRAARDRLRKRVLRAEGRSLWVRRAQAFYLFTDQPIPGARLLEASDALLVARRAMSAGVKRVDGTWAPRRTEPLYRKIDFAAKSTIEAATDQAEERILNEYGVAYSFEDDEPPYELATQFTAVFMEEFEKTRNRYRPEWVEAVT